VLGSLRGLIEVDFVHSKPIEDVCNRIPFGQRRLAKNVEESCFDGVSGGSLEDFLKPIDSEGHRAEVRWGKPSWKPEGDHFEGNLSQILGSY